jgi:hypothetical protein
VKPCGAPIAVTDLDRTPLQRTGMQNCENPAACNSMIFSSDLHAVFNPHPIALYDDLVGYYVLETFDVA